MEQGGITVVDGADPRVRERCLFPAEDRVWLIEAQDPGASPLGFARRERERIRALLRTHGAVLLRGFGVGDAAAFEDLVLVFHDRMLDYRYGSSPRTRTLRNVFTSTEYPASQVIPLHNEMSYTTEWPRTIWFFSEICATAGGETPLADSHRVFDAIPQDVRERFLRHGVRYVRNYTDTFDLRWQQVFQTTSREEVERYCASRGIRCEWIGEDLRTMEVCQAAWRHPDDGRWLWMNQAHLFHVSHLEPGLRALMEESYAPDELPRNATFGDGSPIPDDDLEAVRAAYRTHQLAFPWQPLDVLLVDNLGMAHGRGTFEGARRVLVAMGESLDSLRSG